MDSVKMEGGSFHLRNLAGKSIMVFKLDVNRDQIIPLITAHSYRGPACATVTVYGGYVNMRICPF